MAPRVPQAEKDESVRRLEALIAWFEREKGLNRTRLPVEVLGRSKSYFSAALSPINAQRAVTPGMREELAQKAGVPLRYWTSKERLDPAVVVNFRSVHSPDRITGALSRERIIGLAQRCGCDHKVIAALATLDAKGHEDDAWWWIDQLIELTENSKPLAVSIAANAGRRR